jgi:hypothetical protein
MREHQTPAGRLTITLRDPATGAIVLERRVPNLVTLAGRRFLSDLLTGAVAGFDRMEMVVSGPESPGGETPPAELEDVALHHAARQRVVPTSADAPGELAEEVETPDGPVTQQRIATRIHGTLEAEPGGAEDLLMTEAGIRITLLNGTDTVLYNRVVFGQITKQPNLQMTLTWEVIF